MLPDNLQTLLQQELKPGERLRWSGQPKPLRLARKEIPKFFVGLFVGAFGIFWMVGASGFKVPDFTKLKGPELFSVIFPLFGLPMIFFALGMLMRPLWTYCFKASRTVYAITSNRAMIISPRFLRSFEVRLIHTDQLHNISRNQFPDGSGDLLFAHDAHYDSEDGVIKETRIGFRGIPDVRAVEQILCKMRDENLAEKK